MQFDWITFSLQIVNVLVLLAILRHFLFRPVARIIARRQEETRAAMEAAEKARSDALQATARAQQEAEKTAAARHDVLTRAQEEAEEQRKQLLEEARKEAAAILAAAHADARKTVLEAEAETLRHARDLAETIAGRALSALPAPPTVEGYAARLADTIAALPEDRRAGLLDGKNLRIVSPHPLSGGDRKIIDAALKPFGISAPEVEIDPALVAGLDLSSSTGTVHNSLAHDLARISEALKDDHDARP
ncbi:ATPase [Labrenzia sp. 011]|uniref:F0F1 ATP synthase subunit B family protein n=1 Tax=Labrenzia sp. 011 TaxID=2171494 RepID=UPI000D51A22C|nr:ATPase [Labrenzia sp. 011]PVB59409.1 ATPase [Labrenzia sp. 011]